MFKKLILHCWDWTFEELRIYFQDYVVHSKFLRQFVTDHSIGFPSHLLILWMRLSFFTEIKQTTTPCMPITMAHCDFVPWKTIEYTWLLASVRYIAHSQQLGIPLTEIVETITWCNCNYVSYHPQDNFHPALSAMTSSSMAIFQVCLYQCRHIK